jgi:hypothetical protein
MSSSVPDGGASVQPSLRSRLGAPHGLGVKDFEHDGSCDDLTSFPTFESIPDLDATMPILRLGEGELRIGGRSLLQPVIRELDLGVVPVRLAVTTPLAGIAGEDAPRPSASLGGQQVQPNS